MQGILCTFPCKNALFYISSNSLEDRSYCKTKNFKAIKTTEAIALTAAGVVLYSLARKKAALGTVNFFPDKIRGFRFEGLTPVITLGLGAQNTSNQSFTINAIAGNLYSVQWENTYIGNISSFTPQTIAPVSQKIILLDVRLAMVGIVNDIIEAIQQNNFSQEVQLKATANIDKLQVPINQKYKIGL